MWSNHIHLNYQEINYKMCFQILFDTGLLRIPKTIHVSDALLSSTVFPSLLSLLDCLYIIFFSFPPSFPFLYLFVSYFSTSSPLFIFVALFPSSVLPFLFSSIFFFLPVTSPLFYSPLLTFPQFLVLPLSSHVFSIPAPPLPTTPSPRCSPILWM